MELHFFDLFKPSTWQVFFTTHFSSDVIIHLIDILVVWFVIYKLIMLLNGTKAIQVFKGIAVIIIIRIVSDVIGLSTVSWLMNQVITYGAIAAIVIFQPEVRRGLEHLGRGSILKSSRKKENNKDRLINQLDEAVQYMSKRKIGALISIEKKDSLVDYVETGISLDSDISSQLLINIFIPNTPLHDGAVIIRDDKIASACSYLPLSESSLIPKEYGTRHRAAIGLSEVSDSLTLIVSEETGDVSIAHSNKFLPHLSKEEYLAILNKELIEKEEESKNNGLTQFLEDFIHGFKGGSK
ncbi:diadenylate cyclase CdaA [Vagococcus sp. DIV0080]|uniref:Diadenylate cyclase n=1 Tax=Candidatus Vagococcus giribetii TaxID=2230876 RepID=A0ABS3HTK7_9ENTE|nr:diadenylate cyclase CdaA [Vagococcus sp. DIV0080]MBO0477091.1 diadenylate cyclase CdaA [Vagococcus sp. DIV0080]